MNRTTEKIVLFLELEKQNLLRGNLEQLAAGTPKREKLLQKWSQDHPTREEVASVKSKLDRNHELLEAAERGIKSAIRNIQEVQILSANFARYSPVAGRILSPVGTQNRLNRKS